MCERLGQGIAVLEEEDCCYDDIYRMVGWKMIDSERRV